MIREIRFLARTQVTVLSDRRIFPPHGESGGSDGLAGRNVIRHKDGRIEDMPGKFTAWLEAGDVLSIETPGGGGWGPPKSMSG